MRPTRATVDFGAIVSNLEFAKHCSPKSKNVAVIKANAYGHGAVAVARALEGRTDAFGVALIEEAVSLQDAGVKTPIVLLQGAASQADLAEAVRRGFRPVCHSVEQVAWLRRCEAPGPVVAWLKADTGMHRLGLPMRELDSACEALTASSNVAGLVLCTHLACADDQDDPMTREQVERLREFAQAHKLPLSIANSAGIMGWPEARAEWNRPGYMLYGNSPFGEPIEEGLTPAMRLSSELIAIRDLVAGEAVGYGRTWVAREPTRIGTVAIGYGDGYPRHAPNGTPVLVNGQRAKLAGRVSMDSITVDLGGLVGAKVGDPVELWGPGLSVNEVAASAGTFGYELLAGLTGRVPLVHLD